MTLTNSITTFVCFKLLHFTTLFLSFSIILTFYKKCDFSIIIFQNYIRICNPISVIGFCLIILNYGSMQSCFHYRFLSYYSSSLKLPKHSYTLFTFTFVLPLSYLIFMHKHIITLYSIF